MKGNQGDGVFIIVHTDKGQYFYPNNLAGFNAAHRHTDGFNDPSRPTYVHDTSDASEPNVVTTFGALVKG